MAVDGPLYPVNLALRGRLVVVVGGGPVAAGKLVGLLECDARVRVVAPQISDGLRERAAGATPPAAVMLIEREYAAGDLVGACLVIAATDDPVVNARVAADADREGVWCNSADDPANCSFTLPARIRQGDLLVTFSTGGNSPALARWLRERYAGDFGPEYVALMEMLAAERAAIRARGGSTEGLAWRDALSSGMLELIREGRLAEAKERLQACLSSSSV